MLFALGRLIDCNSNANFRLWNKRLTLQLYYNYNSIHDTTTVLYYNVSS